MALGRIGVIYYWDAQAKPPQWSQFAPKLRVGDKLAIQVGVINLSGQTMSFYPAYAHRSPDGAEFQHGHGDLKELSDRMLYLWYLPPLESAKLVGQTGEYKTQVAVWAMQEQVWVKADDRTFTIATVAGEGAALAGGTRNWVWLALGVGLVLILARRK